MSNLKLKLKKMCQDQVDNVVDRMHDLCEDGRSDDARALYEEIQDWVISNPKIDVIYMDYINGIFEDDK